MPNLMSILGGAGHMLNSGVNTYNAMEQARLEGVKRQILAAQLQDQQDYRKASLGGILGQDGQDSTAATLSALMSPDGGQQQGGGLIDPRTAAGPSLPGGGMTGMPSSPNMSQAPAISDPSYNDPGGARQAPPAPMIPNTGADAGSAQWGGGMPNAVPSSPRPSPGGTVTPQGGGMGGLPPGIGGGQGAMSLGQMFQRLRSDPKNAGMPDSVLFNFAVKAQQSLMAPDRMMLQYIMHNQMTPYQQQQLGISKERLELMHEDKAATLDLRKLILQQTGDLAQARAWQVLNDPANKNHPFRYNAQSGIATELDGKTPYDPQGASKMGSGGQPRSAPAMAMKKFMEEHPEATADQIASFGADYGQRVKAARDFGTGPLGNNIRSINTAVQHLDTVLEAGKALQSGDSRLVNQAKQAYQKAFGGELPTNFDAMMQIVGPEIVKSIVAGGGGVTEREEAKKILSRVSSPQQLEGAITSLQSLMAGQLNSLRKQYESTTKLEDFDSRFMMPHTLEAMKRGGYEAQGGDKAAGGESSQAPTVSNW